MIVRVYKNLNNGLISIQCKETRLVMGHCQKISLENATFLVNEAGRQRVLRDKRKNVHAYAEGRVVSTEGLQSFRNRSVAPISLDPPVKGSIKVKYNPYKYSTFVTEGGNSVRGAKNCTIDNIEGISAEYIFE